MYGGGWYSKHCLKNVLCFCLRLHWYPWFPAGWKKDDGILVNTYQYLHKFKLLFLNLIYNILHCTYWFVLLLGCSKRKNKSHLNSYWCCDLVFQLNSIYGFDIRHIPNEGIFFYTCGGECATNWDFPVPHCRSLQWGYWFYCFVSNVNFFSPSHL